MQRVVAQGDMRPMAGNAEAMDDLKRILAGREALYAKADLTIDTGGKSQDDAFADLLAAVLQRFPSDSAHAPSRNALYFLGKDSSMHYCSYLASPT